jgi:hypothetical protein
VAGPSARDDLVERSGRVVNESGAPVPGALVSIVASSVPMPEIALVCDGEGRFGLRLPAGRFTFRAHGGTRTGQVEVEGAPAGVEILIVIES